MYVRFDCTHINSWAYRFCLMPLLGNEPMVPSRPQSLVRVRVRVRVCIVCNGKSSVGCRNALTWWTHGAISHSSPYTVYVNTICLTPNSRFFFLLGCH